MSDFATLNFAQNLPQGGITALGGGVANLMQQRQAQKAAIAQQQAYQQALSTYMQDRNPTNLMNLYQAAEPLGKFESAKEAVAEMTSAQRSQDIREMTNILAPLTTGNEQVALENIDRRIEALSNTGQAQDAQSRQFLTQLRTAVADGDTAKAEAILSMMMGTYGEEGTAALDNIYSYNEDRRNAAMTDAELLSKMNNMTVTSEQEKQRLAESAQSLPGGMGRALMDLVSVRNNVDAGSMDSKELFQSEQGLRKEYEGYVEPFRTVVNSAQNLQTANAIDSGVVDQTFIVLLNKILDPDSVVRQSEADMTASAQSSVERLRTWFNAIKEGDLIGPEIKADILQVANLLGDNAAKNITEQRDRIMETVTDFGFDADRIFLSRDLEGGQQPTPAQPTPDEVINQNVETDLDPVAAAQLDNWRTQLISEFPEEAEPNDYSRGIRYMTLEELEVKYQNKLRQLGLIGGGAVEDEEEVGLDGL